MGVSPGGAKLLIWTIVFAIVTTIVIGLRVWAIHIKGKSLQAHDYFAFIAYASICCREGLNWWGIANGLRAHTDQITKYELGVQFQLIVGTDVTWTLGTVCCNLSMLSLYNTLFPVFLTQCHPISYGWNPVPGGSCRPLASEEILSIVFNMVLDTVIALLPLPKLWRLKMPLQNRLTISLMFAMGLIVVAVMAWRLAITLDPSTNNDFVHGLYLVGLVSFLELWLSMIVVSLPTLTPIFRRYIEPFVSKVRGSSNGCSDGSAPKRRLREAQHTIGSEPVKKPRSREWPLTSTADDGYLELEEGTRADYLEGSNSVQSYFKTTVAREELMELVHVRGSCQPGNHQEGDPNCLS
ncbi:hypothetical protein BDV30DRAFT_230090 [Aspergillus minisclerotigenes]|uniref:Rhodopsin domain-containing protein n=1 Tax=Aspergillus minisclerotigenes TaxID=656917 RepID=A0A5N6IT68_9EURO|nr:hypothetical protein BDV30DRAFT_230090 [Aspergillus minisclerotigenes]